MPPPAFPVSGQGSHPRGGLGDRQLTLQLLDGFELRRAAVAVRLPPATERVLAFLALAEHPVRRCVVAGCLWPDASDARASGSLRSALWRLGSEFNHVVESSGEQLGLSERVTVDLHELTSVAHELGKGIVPGDAAPLSAQFERELLPGWYDDWIVLSREHWRQLRLHALEALARLLRRSGQWSAAAEAGLIAVRCDPLRETASAALIETYLAEGNTSEAIRQYRWYSRTLYRELGLRPSSRLTSLMPACRGLVEARSQSPG